VLGARLLVFDAAGLERIDFLSFAMEPLRKLIGRLPDVTPI